MHWAGLPGGAVRAYGDLEEATELAACGVAILVLRDLTGLRAIERARKGKGFDDWLGEDEPLFQNKARLEVSGILEGTDSQVRSRLKQKLEQTSKSDQLGLPAYGVVVEFGRPQTRVAKTNERYRRPS